ncbi:DUF2306 domain-containing protein [bacterium]|nr:DUF2306 domain-containing protein [bacterium]
MKKVNKGSIASPSLLVSPVLSKSVLPRLVLLAVVLLSLNEPAHAAQLQLSDSASWAAQLGASILLYLHIIGGGLGMVFGTLAILSRKGQSIHRLAGKGFFVSMLVCYGVGAGVAPFLNEGQRPNFVAAVLALYLLITAWLAAKRPNPTIGRIEYLGLLVAVSIVILGLVFMRQGVMDPSGTVDGSPPQAFIMFVLIGGIAVLEDFRVIWRRSLNGIARISRHLWRMCMSLFIAMASFFLGQQQILPEAMRGTFWQFGPVLFPLIATVIWLTLQWIEARRKPSS